MRDIAADLRASRKFTKAKPNRGKIFGRWCAQGSQDIDRLVANEKHELSALRTDGIRSYRETQAAVTQRPKSRRRQPPKVHLDERAIAVRA